MNIAQQMWQFCKLASKEPKNNIDPLVRGSNFTMMDGFFSYGFIADFDDRVVICFRETRGNIRSWYEDLKYAPTIETNFGTLHGGFYETWMQFEQTVLDYIKYNVSIDKTIFCTGYSQGAAIATICAAHIAHPRGLNRPCSMINFGSPKVGKSDFRDIYEKLPSYTTRVVNDYDVVVEVPFWDFGFRDVGPSAHLRGNPWHKLFIWGRFSDHAKYDKALSKWDIVKQ